MDVIQFLCPNGHVLRVRASATGARSRCPAPGCGAEVIVPTPQQVRPPEEDSLLGGLEDVGLADDGPSSAPEPLAAPAQGERWQALLDHAVPTLYHGNPFRLLDLPVWASEADARRQAERLLADLPRDVDEATVRKGFAALKRPETRLLAEFFWFWPLRTGTTDEALAAVNRDEAAAEAIWLRERRKHPGVCTHNVAVLHHRRAVELQRVAQEHPLGQRERLALAEHWKRAYQHFGALVAEREFWPLFEARGRQLGVPEAMRCRGTLPLALVGLHGGFALHQATMGETAAVKQMAAQLTGSGFGSDVLREGLLGHQAKAAKRVRVLCANATREADNDPVRGGETLKQFLDRAEAHLALLQVAARPLVEQEDPYLPLALQSEAGEEPSEPQLPGLDQMRDNPADDPTRAVVRAGLFYLQSFGRKTEEWDVVLEGLARLRTLDVHQAGGSLIQATQTYVEYQRATGDGWCVPGYHSLEPGLLRALERAREDAQQKNWADAIDRLERIRSTMRQRDDGRHADDHAIRKPLAYCLHHSVTQLLRQGQRRWQNPIPLLIGMDAPRMEWRHRDLMSFIETLAFEAREGRNPPLCGLCDKGWASYEVVIEGQIGATCASCARRMLRQRDNYFAWMRSKLGKARESLLDALDLAPDNQAAQQKLERLRPLLECRRIDVEAREVLNLALLPLLKLIETVDEDDDLFDLDW